MKPANLKIFKILLLIPLTLIILSALTVTAIYHFFPKEKILAYIAAEAEKVIEKKVEIRDLSYGLTGISLTGISITDSDKKEVVLKIEEATLGFSLRSLLSDEFEITGIYLTSPSIKLEFDSDGKSNIEKMIDLPEIDPDEPRKRTASIAEVVIKDFQVDLISSHPAVDLPEGIYRLSAEILLDDFEEIPVKNLVFEGPGETGRFTGDILITTGENWSVTGDLDVKNASLQWIYDWQDVQVVPFLIINGKVTDLTITADSVYGKADATSTLRGTTSVAEAVGECRVEINNRKVIIKNGDGKINRSNFYLKRLTLNFNGDIVNFDVENINARLGDISHILNFMPDPLYGHVRGNVSYSRFYNGRLSLTGVGYKVKNIHASDINTVVNINDSIIKSEKVKLKINGYPAVFSVATHDKSFERYFAELHIEKMQLAGIPELPARDTGRKDSPGRGFNLPIDINGSVHIENFQYDDLKLDGTRVLFTAKGGTIDIRRLTTGFAGGRFNIQSTIETGSPVMTGSALINFEGVRAHELFDRFEQLERRVFGSLAGRSKIDFELSRKFYETLNGTVEFNADRGKIVDTGIQHGLGIWLSELKYKLSDLEFNKIYGNLTLKGKKIYINSFIFNSPNIRLNMKGGIDRELIADYVTIDLEFNNQFIADLTPAVIFGLSKYKEGSWYTVPFSASGDLTDPRNIRRLK